MDGVHFEDATSFTIHDLVHDFARHVFDDEILVASKHGSTRPNCFRYALLNDYTKPMELSKIRALRFHDCGETRLHDDDALSSAKSLRVLDLGECSIHKLPGSIGLLKQLRYLNAPRIQDEVIPPSITRLSKLIYLNLSRSCTIKTLPAEIGKNGSLMYLDLSGCSEIEKLPESVGGLKELVHLDLSNCSHVNGISLLLGSLKELQYLNLSYCKNIGELPGALAGLIKLQYLNLAFSSYLECCQEAEVLGTLTNLEYLNLSSGFCELKKLPEALGSFGKLKHLNLSGFRNLQELPMLFGDLKSLVHLDLSNCPEVNVLPEAFSRLTNLQHLNLSVTPEDYTFHLGSLTGLLEAIGSFTNLRYLNLSACIDYIYRDNYMLLEDHTIDRFLYCISTLSNLEHLDLSYNRRLFSIPGSIPNLGKLHTLDLSHCVYLRDIPESLCTLDSLRFLYTNGCQSLSKLPQLGSSAISLPHFVVHAGDGESRSNLVLLQHTNPDKLEMSGLENVKSPEEAHSIKLKEKQRLVELKLQWSGDAKRFVYDKMLLEKLVPPCTLKMLEIQGYNGVSFPAWLMGQLPNLETLTLSGMNCPIEWNTSCFTGENEHVIKNLIIRDCPKLKMTPVPPRARHWSILNSDDVLSSWGESSIMSRTDDFSSSSPVVTTKVKVVGCNIALRQWRLLHHLSGHTTLWIENCGDLTISPEITKRLNSLERLKLGAKQLPEWLGELSSLRELEIICREIKELHENMRQLTGLESLELSFCGRMESLPHWVGELTSLKKLCIYDCNGIRSLPEGIQKLTNLQELRIYSCPELKHWCKAEENKMKLAHIEKKNFW